MGKVKNWMMDMEDHIGAAVEAGATNENDVVAFVKANMKVVDENYVKNLYAEFLQI
jgi:hypothetical protein|tara:strand:- start:81 stop:248 length:168 start_codon:yes stop_codon:yes gene_type:complete